MNSSQIKYVRDCLAKRRRDMVARLKCQENKPHEVRCAEVTIEKWRKKSSDQYYEAIERIDRKIRETEETIVLSGEHSQILTRLQELDGWQP